MYLDEKKEKNYLENLITKSPNRLKAKKFDKGKKEVI